MLLVRMSSVGRPRKNASKRSSSPATSSLIKTKKRAVTPCTAEESNDSFSVGDERSAAASPAIEANTDKIPVFKDPNFVHSRKGTASSGNKRARVWKNLKQIVAADRALPWGTDDPTYYSIEAPPSFKPAKKYSDLTGLEAKYTDPHTKIRYSSPDEFPRVRLLPSDIVQGYLALRKATPAVP
ncbi:unnamed protein product [Owenia fusiformis]|uniref:Uncharacterized protein n=1 Tax=Owenia fusiformis TaxID=6347 RepID=A0A8J1Y3X3_OWEFU|nr:unnamed protein product [Owenia fusiformis]